MTDRGNKPSVTVIVAAHKKYRMPDDPLYLPLHVGAEGKKDAEGHDLDLGYVKDNTGDNISSRNATFCELTGLYWAWKNLDSDYIGLVHYRRYMGYGRKRGDPFANILTLDQILPDLGKIRVFVPGKMHYFIETLYSHYAHTHYAVHLDMTRAIIREKYPEYLQSYDRIMKRTSAYMFNMMIMDRELLDEYCRWIFDILFTLEKKGSDQQLSAFQGRLYGRVSELLFNVWLDHKITTEEIRPSQVKEIPIVYIEKPHWVKKGFAFLRAKFFGKKYEKSF